MLKRVVMVLFVLSWATAVNGQSVEVSGSAGPTILDAGHSVAAGIRVSPSSRLTLVFGGERTHLSSRTTQEGGVVSSFRGGTLLLGTAELQFVPLGRERTGPYVLAGMAAGQSRPNVTATFPNRVTNDARAAFFGGGVHVPVGDRVSIFGDLRMMVGAEGVEGIVAVAPLRAGVAWRF